MHTKPQQVSTIDFLLVTGLQEMVVCNILFRIALEQSHQRKENPKQTLRNKRTKQMHGTHPAEFHDRAVVSKSRVSCEKQGAVKFPNAKKKHSNAQT
jgi:hypothetical protein